MSNLASDSLEKAAAKQEKSRVTPAQKAYLSRGLDQPGGKLPLFDLQGRKIPARTITSCIDNGWAKPWFANPLKPDWLVCRLTASGFIAADG